MQFCPKCKSIMVPEKRGNKLFMKCRKCNYKSDKEVKGLKISEKVEKKKGVVLLEEEAIPLPVTDRICPKCENPKAYYWLQQTRSADEPPTQFFRCVKCKHVWREYK